MFVNRTELPLSATAFKFLLAHRLEPGTESRPASCPSGESIEVQFATDDTPYEEIEFVQVEHEFEVGGTYRIIVSGGPGAREYSVVDARLA
jgi:hypothetical protein